MANEKRADSRGAVADNVAPLQTDVGPSKQLRRVGTKIGRKVLPFQKLVVRVGPLHVYRDAQGALSVQWLPRRHRARY